MTRENQTHPDRPDSLSATCSLGKQLQRSSRHPALSVAASRAQESPRPTAAAGSRRRLYTYGFLGIEIPLPAIDNRLTCLTRTAPTFHASKPSFEFLVNRKEML